MLHLKRIFKWQLAMVDFISVSLKESIEAHQCRPRGNHQIISIFFADDAFDAYQQPRSGHQLILVPVHILLVYGILLDLLCVEY